MAEPAAIFELAQRILRGYRESVLGSTSAHQCRRNGARPSIPFASLRHRSSGRQGYALAEAARRLGGDVTLVTTLERPLALDVASSIEVLRVESAQQLHDTMMERAPASDCIIMAAAVTDFTVQPSSVKLKKDAGAPTLHFERTPDILTELVAARREGQIVVGFAAETNDVVENALKKLRGKGVDLLVVNDVSAPGVGFEHATNEVMLLDRDEVAETVSLRSKEDVAIAILTRVAALLSQGAP